MARYVDGFLLPVPKKNVQKYRSLARRAGKVWMDHGALLYMECVADDVKRGKVTSFHDSVKLKPNETIFFSFVVYKSRKHRDAVNKKIENDERIKKMSKLAVPFDSSRMTYGGFKALVDL